MDDRLLLDTAVLAGEIMLKSAGETHRVEDTIKRMLSVTKAEHVEAIVMSSSIIAAISVPDEGSVTLVRHITNRSTNLNRIYKVNDISRRFCDGKIDVQTAHDELMMIKEKKQFGLFQRSICIIAMTTLYPVLLKGNIKDMLLGLVAGAMLSLFIGLGNKIQLREFLTNMFAAFLTTFFVNIISMTAGDIFNTDIVVIGTMYPLLPGVAIVNAVRDTLQGDYLSGGARTMEAFVKTLALGLGVGVALVAYAAIRRFLPW